MAQQFPKLYPTHGCDNYERQVRIAHLPSMPVLANCPTFSSLLLKDESSQVSQCNADYIQTCPPNSFITRKHSLYILAAMLVLGIIVSAHSQQYI